MRISPTALAAALMGCATASPDADTDAMPGPSGDASVVASSCPPGQFATGFGADGTLACAPIGPTALEAFEAHCSIHLGQRDSCDGCTSPPTKWGRVSGSDCENGAGAGNTCASASLAGVDLPLFGLNTDGDVNDDDKLYAGFTCAAPEDMVVGTPCPASTYLAGFDQCVSARAAIVEYLGAGCDIYFGWRDDCDGCLLPPAKWGRSGDDCEVGAGLDSNCIVPQLGDQLIQTFALNTDGDVDDNDKLYLGFQCAGAEGSLSLATSTCPDGELVVGIDSEGMLECASPVIEAEAAVRDGCSLYLGWRDECNGCLTPPSKWGRVGHAACENGAGAANSCIIADLGGVSLPLFGLNTDGDVDDNDKLYVGLSCL